MVELCDQSTAALPSPCTSSLASPHWPHHPGLLTIPDQSHIVFLAPCGTMLLTSSHLCFALSVVLSPQLTGNRVSSEPTRLGKDGEMGIPVIEKCNPWPWTQRPGGHPCLPLASDWHRSTCFADLGGCSTGRALGT